MIRAIVIIGDINTGDGAKLSSELPGYINTTSDSYLVFAYAHEVVDLSSAM